MRPPDLNEDTLRLLYETGVEDLPPIERWLDVDEEEIGDRYVMIGEQTIGKESLYGFGGCWPNLSDALESYDWNAGAPVFVVDLFSAPPAALIDIALDARPNGHRSLADERGEPVIP